MLSVNLGAESRGCRVLLQRPPKGTPSSILARRLGPCSHRQRRPCLGNFRPATTSVPHSPASISHGAAILVQSLVARSNTNNTRSPARPDPANVFNTASKHDPMPRPISPAHDASPQLADPFRDALLAMREGDTRKVLACLRVIEGMSQEDLRDTVAAIPRTTFTEFFRALDPLRVAQDCDSIGDHYVSVGMYQLLNMTSIMDVYGVRKLYTKLMGRLLLLKRALEDVGHTLHLEEYIALIRCAAASSDLLSAGGLWNDLSATPLLFWRNLELYNEYMKARFLTEPLYTGHEKTLRMVTPLNLHQSRTELTPFHIRRLEYLRLHRRARSLRFGLNKGAEHVEEWMRPLRRNGPARRLFRTVIAYHSFRITESLLCTVMVALGRAGSLRIIGKFILEKYLGIKSPHPYEFISRKRPPIENFRLSSKLPHIQPTVRLMRAVVETYGSNAEISIAFQLVEFLSNAYKIPIPRDVWHDLLQWTYVMSTPGASTGWAFARLEVKIPGPQAVEMIWNTMISPPYNHVPSFRDYNTLIRSLIGRRIDLELVLPRIREAIQLHKEQCREYKAAVLEYTLYVRAGTPPSTIISRVERARYKQEMMWFHISTWFRMLLKRAPCSSDSCIPSPLPQRLLEEFRPFLYNPLRYPTPTGHVSLVDPALETFQPTVTGDMTQKIPMKNRRGKWAQATQVTELREYLSSHSLAEFKASELGNPLHLLAPRRASFVVPDAHRRPADGFGEM